MENIDLIKVIIKTVDHLLGNPEGYFKTELLM